MARPDSIKERRAASTNNLIGRIVAYVHANLQKNLRPATTAGHFNISTVTLRKYFQAKYGLTYHRYVQDIRMELAYRLIVTEGKQVKEAMYLTGYRNRGTFIRLFRQYYQVLPSELK